MAESIYNLVPRAEVVKEKAPLYRSKHNPKKPVTGSTFCTKGTTRIIGAGGNYFTHKEKAPSVAQGGAIVVSKPSQQAKPFKRKSITRKPAVPSKSEKPVMGVKTCKDFVKTNAMENILREPKETNKKEIRYREKPDYGKVPEYLEEVKDEIQREKEMIEEFVRQQTQPDEEDQVDILSEAEKKDILRSLEAKWKSINHEYQKICHQTVLDTISKVRRKENLERELTEVEQDIAKLKAQNVLIVE